MKIKTITSMITILVMTMFIYARPPMSRPMHHHTPPPPIMHHHHRGHHHTGAFWTGVGIGLIGSTIVHPLPPTPVAIGPVTGRVWVPPVYEMRPIYDRYGNIFRYEQVMVSAGYWRY